MEKVDITGIEVEYHHLSLYCSECGKTYRYFTRAETINCPNTECTNTITVPETHKHRWREDVRGTLMALDIEQPGWEKVRDNAIEQEDARQGRPAIDEKDEPVLPIRLKGQDER